MAFCLFILLAVYVVKTIWIVIWVLEAAYNSVAHHCRPDSEIRYLIHVSVKKPVWFFAYFLKCVTPNRSHFGERERKLFIMSISIMHCCDKTKGTILTCARTARPAPHPPQVRQPLEPSFVPLSWGRPQPPSWACLDLCLFFCRRNSGQATRPAEPEDRGLDEAYWLHPSLAFLPGLACLPVPHPLPVPPSCPPHSQPIMDQSC